MEVMASAKRYVVSYAKGVAAALVRACPVSKHGSVARAQYTPSISLVPRILYSRVSSHVIQLLYHWEDENVATPLINSFLDPEDSWLSDKIETRLFWAT